MSQIDIRDPRGDSFTGNLVTAQKGEIRKKVIMIIQHENRFKTFMQTLVFVFVLL